MKYGMNEKKIYHSPVCRHPDYLHTRRTPGLEVAGGIRVAKWLRNGGRTGRTGDEMEEQTLETLKSAPFNKMRMCVFPKRLLIQ